MREDYRERFRILGLRIAYYRKMRGMTQEQFAEAIGQIREVVRGGAPLSVAMERQHGMFSRLYLNMVRAGEAGGDAGERIGDGHAQHVGQ